MSIERTIALIKAQQTALKTKNNAFYVGEQLKDIVRNGTPEQADIVLHDLERSGMGIGDAEKKIAEYALAHKEGSQGCCPPQEADRIIREFYGLGKESQSNRKATPINLLDFM
ncbi:hypothetical protein [Pygmaiobacter massiliensis]|uniref:hypothetical protein n=1 Tax=Pygmaiobacter massiliensis TaxID=1917873 RepID=UPI000C7D4E3C|nr:hypothetical protein [Pygmaiobacter massiliensis]